MKKYTFVLNFGYVESSKLAFIPFTSTNKYKDAKIALVDLAKFLQEKYLLAQKDSESSEPPMCCSVSKDVNADAKFCSTCGGSLNFIIEFDDEHFQEWLYELSSADINTFHSFFIPYNEEDRWISNGFEGAANQRFVYQAEWVLSAALGFPHGETTFEDLCKERTKTKQDSFSYY